MSNSVQKIESLQALRALAFLGIFLLHVGCVVEWATLGVACFFVLSGFLLVNSYRGKELELSIFNNFKFSIKKIKKLYPLHIITMLIACYFPLEYIVENHAYEAIGSLIKSVLLNVFLVQTFTPIVSENIALNGVAWYLSVSLVLYFLFPVILYLIRKIDKPVVLICSAIILWLLMYACGYYFIDKPGADGQLFTYVTYTCPLYRLGDFYIGCVAGYLVFEKYDVLIKQGVACKFLFENTIIEVFVFLLTVAFYLCTKIEFQSKALRAVFSNWTWALIFLALLWILIFARRAGIFTRFLSNRVLIFIGDYSAYLFLIHYEVTKFGKYFLQKAQLQLTLSKALVLIIVELLVSLGLSILYKKAENFILGKISANKAK